MAEYTTNYNLIKPAQTDFFNVDDLNDNADKIDTALKTNADGVSAANAAIAQNTSDISANTAAIAQNTSDIAANTSAIGSNTTAIGQNTTAIGQRVKYSDALTMEEIEAATSLTDKVAAAAAAKSLKDALSTLTTLESATLSSAYGNFYFYKVGRVAVCVSDGMASAPAGSILFGTIPSGFNPVRDFNFESIQKNNSNALMMIQVRQNGQIGGYNYGGATSTAPNLLGRTFAYITA